MSHNIKHATYSEKVNKKEVQAEWDEYVRMEDWQEGASGLVNPIRWLEQKIYPNYEEAQQAIERLDNGWYDQLAVKYYSPIRTKNDKHEALLKSCDEAYREYMSREKTLYAEKVTSAFIGCKKCGSKVARQYIKSNHCPVCHNELRPEHMLKWVKVAENKWRKACNSEKEWVEKHSKKEVRWLVKIEYHT